MAHRRIRPVLALGGLLLAATVAADRPDGPAADPEKLRRRFAAALTEDRLEEAERLGLELVRRDPGSATHRYNLACVHSRAGDADAAVVWLGSAAESGFRRPFLLRRDPDLAAARRHPHFPRVTSAVNRNLEAYARVLRRHMEDDPPLLVEPRHEDLDGGSPLVIALHGFGGRPSGYPSAWRGAARAAGAYLACPHGMGRVGSGFSWRDEDEAVAVVEATLEWVRARHRIDAGRVVLTGFSQGGTMAMVAGFLRPGLFCGVIPMSHGFAPQLDRPPPAPRDAPRFHFMVGAEDDAAGDVRAAAATFEETGYHVSLRIYPGVGHAFPRFADRELGRALRLVLGDS